MDDFEPQEVEYISNKFDQYVFQTGNHKIGDFKFLFRYGFDIVCKMILD